MMRSLYSGVSGLKTHQTRMDVIGNNIANVNTAGFKKSRVVFKDTFYQAVRGSSRPTDARGGTNPMGIGLGVALASIDQIHTPAATATTSKNSDVAIDGNGYFVLQNGNQLFYTRAGNFDLDEWGNFVSTSNGYRVMGWVADLNGNINTVAEMTNIDISPFLKLGPMATTSLEFTGNLNTNSPIYVPDPDPTTGTYAPFDPVAGMAEGASVIPGQRTAHDSRGNEVVIYYRFYQAATDVDPATGEPTIDPATGEPNVQWYCDISIDPAFGGAIVNYDPVNPTELTGNVVRVNNIAFDNNGKLLLPLDFNLTIDRSEYEAENMALNFDFSALTCWDAESKPVVSKIDGYAPGSLVEYRIGIDGILVGAYDNGMTLDMARIGVATFQNPSGLQQAGSNLFQVSSNSGQPLYGAPGDEGVGALIPGSLEMSNVDLAEEFTDMIVTQRGFQANSRIITTSDEMLQELVNLKR